MKVLIITGGNIDDDFAFSFLLDKKYDEVIAVDGGLAFVDRAGTVLPHLKPTHLVGDFDTIDPTILGKYVHQENLCVHQYIPEKDYTDTDIAVKLAIQLLLETDAEKMGGQEESGIITNACESMTEQSIHILGATGTRLDHVLANLQMLKRIMEAGICGAIIDKHNYIQMIQGDYEIRKSNVFGKYLSLIPASMTLCDVTLEGFKYPLCHADTFFGESLCVSNELIDDIGRIRIKEGMAWMILSRD